jgi:hypothetical protein
MIFNITLLEIIVIFILIILGNLIIAGIRLTQYKSMKKILQNLNIDFQKTEKNKKVK